MSLEAKSIKRHKNGDDNSYSQLRKEAISLNQQLSSHNWTDYNVHDPGITIVEQVCYALTDLLHRIDTPVEDFFTSEDNSMLLNEVGLFKPREILPMPPVTIEDYEKLIFDSIEEVNNVWVAKVDNSWDEGTKLYTNLNCLYAIKISLSSYKKEGLEKKKSRVIKKVKELYYANRNLCEDLYTVEVIEPIEIRLEAQIQIQLDQSPAAIIAKAYQRLNEEFSSSMEQKSFIESITEDKIGVEEIYSGPLLSNGYINNNNVGLSRYPSEHLIVSILMGVEGIHDVDKIKITYPDHNVVNTPIVYTFPIEISKEGIEPKPGISALSGNRNIPLTVAQVKKEFLKLQNNSFNSADSPKNLEQLFPMPQGMYQQFSEYSPIEDSFPLMYGLGEYGSTQVVEGALSGVHNINKSTEVLNKEVAQQKRKQEAKSTIMQMKGYLLLFDQILYNACHDLGNLKSLFTIGNCNSYTYSSKAMINSVNPGIESIYTASVTEINDMFSAAMAKLDENFDRKSALLDFILSLYGLRFTQRRLKAFTIKHHQEDYKKVLLQLKIIFTLHIPEITTRRFLGINYAKTQRLLDASRNHITGMQKIAALKLGFMKMFDETYAHKCDAHLFQEGYFYVVEHILLRRIKSPNKPHKNVSYTEAGVDFYNCQISIVLPAFISRLKDEAFQDFVEEIVLESCPAHIHPNLKWLCENDFKTFENQYEQFLAYKAKVANGLEEYSVDVSDKIIENVNVLSKNLTFLLR